MQREFNSHLPMAVIVNALDEGDEQVIGLVQWQWSTLWLPNPNSNSAPIRESQEVERILNKDSMIKCLDVRKWGFI